MFDKGARCRCSVKPAIFDLFLALGIAAYLGALYFVTLVSPASGRFTLSS